MFTFCVSNSTIITQPTFTFSISAIKTLEKSEICFKLTMKTPEQVNVCLEAITGFAYFFKAAMLRKYASLD